MKFKNIEWAPEIQTKLENINDLNLYLFLSSMIKNGFLIYQVNAACNVPNDIISPFLEKHDKVVRFQYYQRRTSEIKWNSLLEVFIAINRDRLNTIVDKYEKIRALQ